MYIKRKVSGVSRVLRTHRLQSLNEYLNKKIFKYFDSKKSNVSNAETKSKEDQQTINMSCTPPAVSSKCEQSSSTEKSTCIGFPKSKNNDKVSCDSKTTDSIEIIPDYELCFTERRRSLVSLGFGKPTSYQRLNKIGEGTYATVYKGFSRVTNTIVAIKDIVLQSDEGLPCTAIRETSLLRGLKHVNILALQDVFYTATHLSLVFEYMETDLRIYIDKTGCNVGVNNTKVILFQILRGLNYIHTRNVLHRDLKPQNLLINSRGDVKLGDFGLARAKCLAIKTFTNEVVTLWYRPPDVIMGNISYTSSIDMWGVGCILYEIFTGEALFNGMTAQDQFQQIISTVGQEFIPDETADLSMDSTKSSDEQYVAYQNYVKNSFSTIILHNQNDPIKRIGLEGFDLLEKFLQLNPKFRISSLDAMNHPFFNFPKICHLLPDSNIYFPYLKKLKLQIGVSLFIIRDLYFQDRIEDQTPSNRSSFYIQ